ncbi:MAG TPA: DJ-1/PfpI family protein [Thermomicrobiales bacterium]|jgi:transcriptional regulator GlxA family with amidase domain|nr:DJ-1/PfpI family protein [Thermomicrobiales bacterium]
MTTSPERRTVGILIFEGVEVLDFCGPFEVFSVTRRHDADGQPAKLFDVLTIAETSDVVVCTGGLKVVPDATIDDHPPLDIVVVPGGMGTRREMTNRRLLDWVAARNGEAELMTSVCTGAFLLANSALLEGLPATTHWASIDHLRELATDTMVRDDQRVVDTGRIITSAGISAGIDLALHVVARLHGDQVALGTARTMEYLGDWQHAAGNPV